MGGEVARIVKETMDEGSKASAIKLSRIPQIHSEGVIELSKKGFLLNNIKPQYPDSSTLIEFLKEYPAFNAEGKIIEATSSEDRQRACIYHLVYDATGNKRESIYDYLGVDSVFEITSILAEYFGHLDPEIQAGSEEFLSVDFTPEI